jgi:hypothetical protein
MRVVTFVLSQGDTRFGKYVLVGLALGAVLWLAHTLLLRHPLAALLLFVLAYAPGVYFGLKYLLFQRKIMNAVDEASSEKIQKISQSHGRMLRQQLTGAFVLFVILLQILATGGILAAVAGLSSGQVIGPGDDSHGPVVYLDGLLLCAQNLSRTALSLNFLDQYNLWPPVLEYKSVLGKLLAHFLRLQFELIVLAGIFSMIRRHSVIRGQLDALRTNPQPLEGPEAALLRGLNQLGVRVAPYAERLTRGAEFQAVRADLLKMERELREVYRLDR